MPVSGSNFFLRFGKYFLAAYAVLGTLLFVGILKDVLSQELGLAIIAVYIVGLFILRRAAGYVPPFGFKMPNSYDRSSALKDLLRFFACFAGACAVVVIGVLINPTSIIGVLFVAVPSIVLVLLGGLFIAKALNRFLKFRFLR